MDIIIGSSTTLAKALGSKKNRFFLGRTNPYNLKNWIKIIGLSKQKEIESASNILIELMEKECMNNSFNLILLQGISSNNWDESIYVNTISAGILSESFIQILTKNNKKGTITLIGSATAYNGGKLPYATSKAALFGLLNALHLKYSDIVRTNLVIPGAFDGKMTSDWDDEKKNKIAGDVFTKRIATAKEIVDAIIFAINNKYVAGSIINMTSGKVKIQ